MRKHDDKAPRREAPAPPSDVQAWLDGLSEAERADLEQTWRLAGLARGAPPEAATIEAAYGRLWTVIEERGPAPRRREDRPAPGWIRGRRLRQGALSVVVVALVGVGLLLWLSRGAFLPADSTDESAAFIILLRGGDVEGRAPEERGQIVEALAAWAGALQQAGRFRAGDELTDGGRVLLKEDGRVVDRPFTMSADGVSGYFIIEAQDYDEALEIARGCPYLDFGGTLEVRQLVER